MHEKEHREEKKGADAKNFAKLWTTAKMNLNHARGCDLQP